MPMLASIRHSSSLGRESKAFLKSTKHVYVSRLASFLFSIKNIVMRCGFGNYVFVKSISFIM